MEPPNTSKQKLTTCVLFSVLLHQKRLREPPKSSIDKGSPVGSSISRHRSATWWCATWSEIAAHKYFDNRNFTKPWRNVPSHFGCLWFFKNCTLIYTWFIHNLYIIFTLYIHFLYMYKLIFSIYTCIKIYTLFVHNLYIIYTYFLHSRKQKNVEAI